MENKFQCPVCGYVGLDEDPIADSRTYEICPCCFCEFGYDVFTEEPQSIINYRNDWIQDGACWSFRYRGQNERPEGWDAIDQMRKAGFFSIESK